MKPRALNSHAPGCVVRLAGVMARLVSLAVVLE